MVDDNPYESPEGGGKVSPAAPGANVLMWSVVTVGGTSIAGGLAGLAIGAMLGTFVPRYYRSVFSDGFSPGFDPVAVGIGQGLTQGVVFGCFAGLALVALFYWYRSRSTR